MADQAMASEAKDDWQPQAHPPLEQKKQQQMQLKQQNLLPLHNLHTGVRYVDLVS